MTEPGRDRRAYSSTTICSAIRVHAGHDLFDYISREPQSHQQPGDVSLCDAGSETALGHLHADRAGRRIVACDLAAEYDGQKSGTRPGRWRA